MIGIEAKVGRKKRLAAGLFAADFVSNFGLFKRLHDREMARLDSRPWLPEFVVNGT